MPDLFFDVSPVENQLILDTLCHELEDYEETMSVDCGLWNVIERSGKPFPLSPEDFNATIATFENEPDPLLMVIDGKLRSLRVATNLPRFKHATY